MSICSFFLENSSMSDQLLSNKQMISSFQLPVNKFTGRLMKGYFYCLPFSELTFSTLVYPFNDLLHVQIYTLVYLYYLHHWVSLFALDFGDCLMSSCLH